jgi:hypothetical protein
LNQLGPEAMAQLKRLAEQIQAGNLPGAGGAAPGVEGEEEEAVPELVEAAEGAEEQQPAEVSFPFFLRCHLPNSSLTVFIFDHRDRVRNSRMS